MTITSVRLDHKSILHVSRGLVPKSNVPIFTLTCERLRARGVATQISKQSKYASNSASHRYDQISCFHQTKLCGCSEGLSCPLNAWSWNDLLVAPRRCPVGSAMSSHKQRIPQRVHGQGTRPHRFSNKCVLLGSETCADTGTSRVLGETVSDGML
jgi:hypothetical protein